MKVLKLVLLGALALAVSACGGGETPQTANSIAPLALWQGQDVKLAGTYDSAEGKLRLTEDTKATFAKDALKVVRPGQTSAIAEDVQLSVGDALEVIDSAGQVVGTIVVEDMEWVDSLEDQVRTAFKNVCIT